MSRNEQLTPSVVDHEFRERMLRAFARYRDENDIKTDTEAANRLGLSPSYVHWLTLKRQWTMEGVFQLAAGLQCPVAEMLRLAGDADEA